MRRAQVIACSSAVALLFGTILISLIAYLVWSLSINAEEARLHSTAERTLARADETYQQIRDTLKHAETGRIPPCSVEHIRYMHNLVTTTPSVTYIGYFEHGKLRCSSGGWSFSSEVGQSHMDHFISDDNAIALDVRSEVANGQRLLSFMHGDYEVLVDPRHFVDVIADSDIRLALASPDGRLIAQQEGLDPDLLERLLREPNHGLSGETLYTTARSEEWLAIATAPRTVFDTSLRRRTLLFAPLAAAFALVMGALAVWFCKRHLSLRNELALAIRRRELRISYQPIIEISTGICVGAEALVRWQHRRDGHISPDIFIPLAEQSGTISEITQLVIETVIMEMKELLTADRSAHIAINLAAEDIRSGSVLKLISRLTAKSSVQPQQIWLEATERSILDIDTACVMFAAARRAGHSVAIDDFGVGYSSLQYLQQLPLDALKIDRSFIQQIGRDSSPNPVTAHIISLAKELDLWLVAEGIENEDQLTYLLGQNVQFGQGWLFSRPLPANDFIAFHRERQRKYGEARQNMQNLRTTPVEREQHN